MKPLEERQEKLRRVRRYMAEQGLGIVFLTTRGNFSWLTAGALNYVSTAAVEGVTTIAVTGRQCYILASRIEAPRMMAEELDAGEFKLVEFPWYDEAAKRAAVLDLASGKKAAADTDLFGLPRLGGDFTELRYSLTAGEIGRYRQLGRDVSLVLSLVAREIKPGDAESDVEGWMGSIAMTYGIRPFVRLVAADNRIAKFRHPIPTGKKIAKRVMMVICGERHGLVIAATRLVNFGPLTKDLKRRHQAVCNVDAAMILSTRPGATAGQVLQAGVDAYAREGFAGEWQLHHQGGPTGYAGREYFATPGLNRPVLANQAFAWNPSITGTKSEDTILTAGKDRNGKGGKKGGNVPEVLSEPIDWPMIEGRFGDLVIPRADILVR